jgi:hypothetical protein
MIACRYKPVAHVADAEPHQLVIDPSDIPESEHLIRISPPENNRSDPGTPTNPRAEQRSSSVVASRATMESVPRICVDAATFVRMGNMLISARHNLATIPPNILPVSANVLYEVGYVWAGQMEQLQQYQLNLKAVSQTLRCLESDGLILDADAVLQPVDPELLSTHQNICVPFSLNGPSTQYSSAVLDALNTWVCEFQVKLREALNWLDELIGCVRHVLCVIFKFFSSPIRLFCNVRWEKRRWYFYHGTRPPRLTVQAIMSLFTMACSRSHLAH